MDTYAEALYHVKRGFIIVGLTGYTGSGCSTASRILRRKSTPDLPEIETLNNGPERRLFDKLKRVWNNLAWEGFVEIEASRVIFMLAIHRALRYNFRTGGLAELRKLALPHKTELRGLKYLTSDAADIKKMNVAKALIDAYNVSKTLYIPFKKSSNYDLARFIEVMQDYGDDLRKFGGVQPTKGTEPKPKNLFVLPEALRRLIKAHRILSGASSFVIDAFRNPYEVEYFKRRYGEFYLVAIQRPRRERRQDLEKLPEEAIDKLEEREKGGKVRDKRQDNIHEWVTSQNIDECFQKADLFIENVYDKYKTWPHLRYDLIKLLCLVKKPGCIPPTKDERNMEIAMSASHNSGCLSRRVGAVVVNDRGYVLGVGWNGPPRGQVACTLRTGRELVDSGDPEVFSEYERSPKFVEHIQTHSYKNEPFCFKDSYAHVTGSRQAEFTRALHAEENALLQAAEHGSEALEDATLYSTDSPCTLCAKKAYQLGISRIVYVEEYPGIAMEQTLMTGKQEVSLEQFKGATSSAYYRLFSSLMPEKDLLTLYSS